MFGLAGPGALVWILWILLLVVGINPTTLFQNISQLRNEKDMADRNKAFKFGKSSIEARKRWGRYDPVTPIMMLVGVSSRAL